MSENRSGYIYLVQMEGSNLYKIGRTKDMPRRMSEFGILLPFKYRLVACFHIYDAPLFESRIHTTLASQRQNGEWFSLTEWDVGELRLMMLYYQAVALVDRLEDVEPQGVTADEWYGHYEKILRVQHMAVRRVLRRSGLRMGDQSAALGGPYRRKTSTKE